MNILKAKLSDIEDILKITEEQRTHLKEKGIPQWQGEYPSKSDFENDINLERLYVVKVGEELISFFALIYPDHNYDYIEDGKWIGKSEYIAVHKTAVKNSYKRKGVMTFVFNSLKEKYQDIRVDTHALNEAMNLCLKKNGFAYCGIVYMEDKTKRNAYEWLHI